MLINYITFPELSSYSHPGGSEGFLLSLLNRHWFGACGVLFLHFHLRNSAAELKMLEYGTVLQSASSEVTHIHRLHANGHKYDFYMHITLKQNTDIGSNFKV